MTWPRRKSRSKPVVICGIITTFGSGCLRLLKNTLLFGSFWSTLVIIHRNTHNTQVACCYSYWASVPKVGCSLMLLWEFLEMPMPKSHPWRFWRFWFNWSEWRQGLVFVKIFFYESNMQLGLKIILKIKTMDRNVEKRRRTRKSWLLYHFKKLIEYCLSTWTACRRIAVVILYQ